MPKEMPQRLLDKYSKRGCFTTSDLYMLFRCRRVKCVKDMLPILGELAAAGYVRKTREGNWQIHPLPMYGYRD